MKCCVMAVSGLALLLCARPGRGQTLIDLKSQTKSVDFSGASTTKPSKTGSALPAVCGVGEFYFLTGTTAGQNLYGCTAVNVWSALGAPAGPPPTGLPAMSNNAGTFLTTDGTVASWSLLAGDVLGVPSALRVAGLQGRLVSTTAPTDGQVLRWNNTTAVWEPHDSVWAPNYSKPITAATTLSILGIEHALGNPNLIVTCYDNSSPAQRVEPDTVTVNPLTYDVVINFSTAQSGRCVVNGSGSGGSAPTSTGGGPVSFPQITGTLVDAQLAPGVNALKLGGGTVTNTAFGYLTNVTSDLQAQFAGKSPATHSHIAGGDVSGDITNVTVVRIQNQPVGTAAATDGQVLMWSQANSRWQAQTIAQTGGGTGTPGASMAAQLGDFNVSMTSTTVLTVAGLCSGTTPCNFRFGSQAYQIISPATVTVTSGTGTAYFYLTSDGLLNVGHNLTATCSLACNAVGSVTGFPLNSIPLFSWTASGGTWNAAGARDARAFLSTKFVTGGPGANITETSLQTLVSVDGAFIPSYLAGTATLAFASVVTDACTSEVTLSLPGALPGDSIAPGWPANLPSGILGMMRVASNDNVSVKLCNFTGAAYSPASMTFKAMIVRGF